MAITVRVEVKGQVPWIVTQGSSSKNWIAVCDPMNLALEANSLDELYSVINEGVHLLFLDLVRDNELNEYLSERGWQAHGMPQGPVNEDINFQVPWHMLVGAPGDITRSAS
jgi:hypothetical protein